MKKVLFATIALMCSLFVACNKNNQTPETSDDPQVKDTTPASAMLSFKFLFTKDMVENTSLELRFDNGEGEVKTETPKKEDFKKLEWLDAYAYGLILSSSKLPATFTMHRKMTLPNDITGLTSFLYKNGYTYQYALYNAAGEQVYLNKEENIFIGMDSNGEKVTKLVEGGRNEKTITFSFDEKGSLKIAESKD